VHCVTRFVRRLPDRAFVIYITSSKFLEPGFVNALKRLKIPNKKKTRVCENGKLKTRHEGITSRRKLRCRAQNHYSFFEVRKKKNKRKKNVRRHPNKNRPWHALFTFGPLRPNNNKPNTIVIYSRPSRRHTEGYLQPRTSSTGASRVRFSSFSRTAQNTSTHDMVVRSIRDDSDVCPGGAVSDFDGMTTKPY